ncbi:Putative hemolysin [Pseudonocardia ammonioxydans]|uniref:Putative hemolysin n=1 Tax=Pseudonocardia ammonioxydans TaxID=260086 RepID=A0A1I5GC08_PSUAM|nr:GNAT family N-acyltransferase [Pseudonocardia ammonioxydans]SFO33081.1 Putative hemolysin [Pseudonocardia ammonioxydans]
MNQVIVSTPETAARRYSLLLTTDPDDVDAAQALRHRVFAGELGATLDTPVPGRDVDRFDRFCDHLVVREDTTGEIVGTYRMLPPQRARAAGGLYADGEFDLTRLEPLRASLVETGRSCVHPDHRSGAVVGLAWAGIARYMLLTGHRRLIGCASVPLADGGLHAAAVWDTVRARHLAPEEHRTVPHRAWDPAGVARDRITATTTTIAALPPLLRGYLRLGARVCGPPAHDPDFGVADFPVLLGMDDVDQRYLRFFLGDAAGPGTPA